MNTTQYCNALDFGFSPDASPSENVKALQAAVNRGGTILVSAPGTYELDSTVFIGSHTTLEFGNGVYLKKTGSYTHVFLNEGALSKTYDTNIVIKGLYLVVNGVDVMADTIAGLRGQVAFYYIKDLKISNFRCLDLDNIQFCIHVSNFEDIIVEDVIIKGDKDGIHLGPGTRFTIRNGVFETYDDAVALNAQDYSTSNPELGWIENGTVENCHDLSGSASIHGKPETGFFCRLISGGWKDWESGMEVQQSDTVVANGRVYRVQMKPDEKTYISTTKPTHTRGQAVLDGITWGMVQEDVSYTCGVRNVIFRDIYVQQKRTPLAIFCAYNKYNRSYYPGSEVPIIKDIKVDNLTILHDSPIPLFSITSPLQNITITNSTIKENSIQFSKASQIEDLGPTHMAFHGCTFTSKSPKDLVENSLPDKEVKVVASGNIELF